MAVIVRVLCEEDVACEERVEVLETNAVRVTRGVNTEVLVCIRERVCTFDGKEDFVDVTVFVEVFDCVEVEVSIIPLKRRNRSPLGSTS